MARVLVAGGAGFLGSHLVDRILKRPDVEKIVVVDCLWTGTWENLAHVNDNRLVRLEGKVEHVRSDFDFDEILHFASPATPRFYMGDPRATISANVSGALRLLDLLTPGGTICFASTSEVYGESAVVPQPESYRGSVDCTGPRASYDESKRCVEALLFELRRTASLNVRVARIFNVYGPRTRPEDGRAVSNFIGAALAGRPLEIYGDGAQTRSWGYVDDIVDGLERFFFAAEMEYPGPLNIGSDRETTVLEMARYIQSLVPGSAIVHRAPLPDDPSHRRPDLTLARHYLKDWSCAVPYEEGIRRTLAWFMANYPRELALLSEHAEG